MRLIFRRLSHLAFRANSQTVSEANWGRIWPTPSARGSDWFPAFIRQCASAQQLNCPPSHSFGPEESFLTEFPNWASSTALVGLSVAAATSTGAFVAADGPSPTGSPDDVDGTAKKSEAATDGLPEGFIDALREAVGSENVVLDDEERLSHAKQWNTCYPVRKLPSAVVYPGWV